jgi:hypothetical protein
MKIGIDLMVFCLRDEDISSAEIGIDVPLEDCEVRLFTFFDIKYISVERSNNEYTIIGANGDEFVCNEKYEVVKYKIEQLRILRHN